jgi:hypothetical protein
VLGILACAALFGAAAAYFHDSRAFGPLALIAYFGALNAVSTRLQKVTIIDEGLLLRSGYTGGLFCQWSEIVAVERGHIGPIRLISFGCVSRFAHTSAATRPLRLSSPGGQLAAGASPSVPMTGTGGRVRSVRR